jgi:hypothetical protein
LSVDEEERIDNKKKQKTLQLEKRTTTFKVRNDPETDGWLSL